MIKVYRNAYKLQIEGEKVANSDKVFSVFETHTDILMKMSKHPNTTFYVLSKITCTLHWHFATRSAVHRDQALVKAWPTGLMSFRLNREFI